MQLVALEKLYKMMYLHLFKYCSKYGSWALYSNYQSYLTKCVNDTLQCRCLYTSVNSSEKFQNMLVDSVFHAEHESDIDLWFWARNATQKSQLSFSTFLVNIVKIRWFSSFDPFWRAEIKTGRKLNRASNRASFALSTHICR